MRAALKLVDVTVAYDRHPAVHHLTGTFELGSLTAIAGPNGAGKSTLLKAIMGDLALTEGTIDLGGLDRRDIGYLPQAVEIDRTFPISVSDVVATGAWRRIGGFRSVTREIARQVEQALDVIGLAGFGPRIVGSLSAGQFQRVLFARLLLQDAQLILLDEPFTAIDARTTADLVSVIRRWHGEGRTVVAVLHDFAQVRAHFPQTLLIAREPVAWGASDDVMCAANLTRAKAMVERWQEDAAVCERAKDVA